jgi:hypothetical protein
MSATQFIITSIQNMSQADRETVFAAFAMDPPQATKTKTKAVKEPKAEKKPRANAGKGTAWSAFSVKIQLDHKDEVDAVKKDAAQRRANAKMSGVPAPDDTKGAHLHWCSAYKAAHEDEWKAFKAEWELKNKTVSDEEAAPMVGGGSTSAAPATAATAATATEAAPKPKRGPKKLADMTPEEQAAAKAKRAENKAKKASAANSADVSRSPSPPKVKDE